jgi:hypothetical protein
MGQKKKMPKVSKLDIKSDSKSKGGKGGKKKK